MKKILIKTVLFIGLILLVVFVPYNIGQIIKPGDGKDFSLNYLVGFVLTMVGSLAVIGLWSLAGYIYSKLPRRF